MTEGIQQFETGAVRSSDAADVRYDLIDPIGHRRLAETYAEGAKKYSDHNWRKGFPCSDVLNHCIRHIELWKAGDRSEDHLAHACWNLYTLMNFEETRPDLMDIPSRTKQETEDDRSSVGIQRYLETHPDTSSECCNESCPCDEFEFDWGVDNEPVEDVIFPECLEVDFNWRDGFYLREFTPTLKPNNFFERLHTEMEDFKRAVELSENPGRNDVSEVNDPEFKPLYSPQSYMYDLELELTKEDIDSLFDCLEILTGGYTVEL